LPARGMGGADAHVAERVLSQFLVEFDGVEELKGVLVLGATNRADILDPAVLRPGRFDEIVEIPPASDADRAAIFRVHLNGKPLADGIDVEALAAKASGFSGARIASACQRAALRAVRRAVREAVRNEAEQATIAAGMVIDLADLEEAVEEEAKAR